MTQQPQISQADTMTLFSYFKSRNVINRTGHEEPTRAPFNQIAQIEIK